MSKETGFAHEFYVSQAWIRCRRDYAKSKGLVCERCGAAGTQVHHKTRLTPENIRDPKVTLGWDNLELLCDECHRREHRGQSGRRWTCDEHGRVAIAPHGRARTPGAGKLRE